MVPSYYSMVTPERGSFDCLQIEEKKKSFITETCFGQIMFIAVELYGTQRSRCRSRDTSTQSAQVV